MTNNENQAIIALEHVVKRFPSGRTWFTALKDINLSLGRGEFAGLVGPSGSGKTTLLNLVGSLDSPSEGKVDVLGQEVEKMNARESASMRKKHLGFIFQTYNLMPVYTVYENVEFPLLLLKVKASKRRKAITEALEWLGIESKAKSKPAQLSGGECQRVAIARAMVKKPEIVLADEPTANLDAENSHHILQTMEQLNRELGTTFLFATHDEKVIKYLKRKIRLFDGKVAADEIIQS
ncbi:MAG: ABC transporter ATP-binding protein [Bacteroidales bacterium]